MYKDVMFVWVTSKKRETHGCKDKSNFLTKKKEKRMSSLSLVSLLQAAAEGSDGSEGSGEDESGDEESSESGGSEDDDGKKEGEEEEENEPLSLEWPETGRKQATYLFLLPIVFPLWLTLPDVRNLVSTDRPRENTKAAVATSAFTFTHHLL